MKDFKDILTSGESPFDASAWSGVQAGLKKKPPYTKIALVASSIIVVAGIIAFSINQNDAKVKPQLTKVEQNENKIETPTQTLTTKKPNTKNITNQAERKAKTIKEENTFLTNRTNSSNEIKTEQAKKINVELPDIFKNGVGTDSKNYNQQSFGEENINYPKTQSSYCLNEFVSFENTNDFDIDLKCSGSNFKQIIKANSTARFELNNVGSYSFSKIGGNKRIIKFFVFRPQELKYKLAEQIVYEKGLPILEINTSVPSTWTSKNLPIKNSNEKSEVLAFTKGTHEINTSITDKKGCISTYSEKISIEENYNLLAPTGFNPYSNDPKVRTFIPVALKSRESKFKMIILDPNTGQQIFSTSSVDQPWDGINQNTGEQAEKMLSYIWKVTLETPEKGEKSEYVGTITKIK